MSPDAPDQPMPEAPTDHPDCTTCGGTGGAELPTGEWGRCADCDDEPLDLQGMPAPMNPDGTPMTRQQLAAELPAGARQHHIDVSMRNLMVQPQKTIAGLVRKGWDMGREDRGYIHHAAMVSMGEQTDEGATARITLFIADEPKPEPPASDQVDSMQAATIGLVDRARRRKGKRK